MAAGLGLVTNPGSPLPSPPRRWLRRRIPPRRQPHRFGGLLCCLAPNPGPRAPQPSPHGQTDIVCLQHGHTSATCPRQRARVGAGRRQTAGMGMEGCWGSTPQPSHTTVSPPRGLDQAGKTLPCSCSPWPVASGSIMGMGMGCLPPGRSFGVGLYQYLDQLLRPHLPVHLQAPDFGDAGAQPPVLPCQQDEPLGTCFGVGEAEPPGSPKPCCPASLARAGDARPLLSPAGMQVPAHLLQMTTQRLMEAQSGLGEPQSAQKRLDSTTQILSATSELERASAMDCCMASTHSSFSWSESAEKLPAGTGMRDGMAAGRGSTAGTPSPPSSHLKILYGVVRSKPRRSTSLTFPTFISM